MSDMMRRAAEPRPRTAAWSPLGNDRRAFVTLALHLIALCNLAFAQPLFDLLGRSGEFFVASRSETVDILLLVGLVSLGIPAVLLGIEGLARLVSQRLWQAVHTLVVAGLVAVIALLILKQASGVPGLVVVGLAALIGIVATIAYWWVGAVRTFITVLAAGMVVFAGNFLLNSDVTKLVLPSGGTSGTVTARIDATTPVVMVIFDELPLSSLLDERMMIDPIRYPNFAALADDAHWFRNATTVAQGTFYAIPAISTGRYPKEGQIPIALDYPNNLFTWFGNSYDLHVSEAGTHLCPDQLCKTETAPGLYDRWRLLLVDTAIIYAHIVLPDEMRRVLPSMNEGWHNFMHPDPHPGSNRGGEREEPDDIFHDFGKVVSSDRVSNYRAYVKSVKQNERPSLHYLHILLPHVPWKYLASGKVYGPEIDVDGLKDEKWVSDEWPVVHSYQRHLLQVEYTDLLLGEFIQQLKTTGLYDSALVIVLADHGASFHPGERRRHLTTTNLHDLMTIPLFIKLPGQHEGVINDRPVEVIDIIPTIGDVLNTPVPWQVEGFSVFDSSAPLRTSKIAFDDSFVQFSMAPTLEGLRRSVDYKLSLFGSGSVPTSILRFGQYHRLIGQKIHDIVVADPIGIRVKLDAQHSFLAVEPSSGFSPARITGYLDSVESNQEPVDLAIAVNGMIQAVTQTFRDGDVFRFAAFVPESSLQPGQNDIQVFAVSGPEHQPLLHQTVQDSLITYRLIVVEGEEQIVASDGQTHPVKHEATKGTVDHWRLENGMVYLTGWAAEIARSRPASRIVVFVDGKFASSGRPSKSRPDVAEYFDDPALLPSGFDVIFPQSQLTDSQTSRVRVFALSDGLVASELNTKQDFPWRGEDE